MSTKKPLKEHGFPQICFHAHLSLKLFLICFYTHNTDCSTQKSIMQARSLPRQIQPCRQNLMVVQESALGKG